MITALIAQWTWAARDLLRRPGEALLSALALAAVGLLLALSLLLTRGLELTTAAVLDGGPSLLVRRVGPGGWAPMPAGSVEEARKVRGATRVHARSWGVVRLQDRAVTVMAADDLTTGVRSLRPGDCVVGPGLGLEPGTRVQLEGASRAVLRVVEVLPLESGLVAHDLVFTAPADARALLGLPGGASSDLAIWTFHEAEVDALRADLARAFPHPVRIESSREARGAALGRIERLAGLRTLALIPALLALGLLALAVARSQRAGRADIGLLRSLGWRAADIVRLQLFRGLLVALPALALAWASAYWLVFGAGLGGLGTLLMGWDGAPPFLSLDPAGALLTLLEVGALVLGPWLAAILIPALGSAAVDPEEWLRGEGGG